MRRRLSLAAVLLSFLCATHASAKDSARITSSPQDSVVELGKKISFFCRADGNPMPTIKWSRNGRDLSQSRYVTKTLPSGVSTLRVEPVRNRDNDTNITCIVNNGVGETKMAEARLLVLKSGEIPSGYPKIIDHPKLKAVEKGRTARMACRYSGDNPVEVVWLRDLLPIDMKDKRYQIATVGSPGALLITNSSESDEGKYECVVRNKHGVAHSKSAHLYVKVRRVPPHFTIAPLAVYEVKPGGLVNLSCTAVGYPMPAVYWRTGVTDSDTPESAPIGRNVLVLKDVRESKNVTCIAVSLLGNIEFTSQILVKELPAAPSKLRIVNQTAYSVSLEWNPISKESEVQNYIVQYRPKNQTKRLNQTGYADGNDYLEWEPVVTPKVAVTGLEPFTVYEFKVIARNSVGRGAASYPVETTTNETKPESPPVDVKSRALKPDKITVTWGAPVKPNGEITMYHVWYSKNPTDPFVNWKEREVKEGNMVNIDGLDPDTLYTVRVQARNRQGASGMSDPVQVFTKPGAPGQPTNVRATSTGSDRMHIEWTAPPFHQLSEYLIRYNSTEAGSAVELTTKSTKTSFTVQKLQPDTNYSFQVVAKSDRGLSPPSFYVTEKTKPSVPTEAPESVTAESLGSDSIRVIWEAPPRDSNKGAVQRYKIRWEPLVAEDGVDGEVIQEANRHRSFTIEHLQTWTEYKIWVSAGNSKGFGPESSPVVVKTGEDVPGPPRDLQVNEAGPTSVKLTWRDPVEPNGVLRSYVIQVDRLKEGQWNGEPAEIIEVKDASAQQYVLSNLKPNNEYSFMVKAINIKGDGEFSPSVQYTVPMEVPSAPRELRLESVEDPVGVKLTWKSPKENGGSEIQQYKVEWSESNSDLSKTAFVEAKASGADLSHRISELENGVRYVIRVSAENEKGLGESVQETLKTKDAVPTGPPINIRYSYVKKDSLQFLWEPPEPKLRRGSIIGYEADVRQNEKSKVLKVNQTELKLSVLADSAQLEVLIRARNSAGPGPWSEVVKVQPPGKELRYPEHIKVQAIRDDAVVVYWSPVKNQSDVDGYEVKYSTMENSGTAEWPSKTVKPASSDHVIIDSLNSNVQYGFRVATLSRKGAISEYSPLLPKKVDPVDVVTDLDAFPITKNSVTLKWAFSRKPAKYSVIYSGHKRYRTHYGTYKEVTEGPFTDYTTDLSFTFPNLRPNTNCTFKVAVIENEETYWPVTLEVATKKEVPPFVTKPEIVTDEISSNGAPVMLEPASEEYGAIMEYWVVVVPKSSVIDNSDHFTLKELAENSIDSVSELAEAPPPTGAWVAGTFAELATKTKFPLGTGTVVGKYVNRPLKDGTEYRVFLRAFIDEGTTDAEKHYASSHYSNEFRVWGGDTRKQVKEGGGLWIIGPVVAIVVIAIIIGTICIFLMQRNKKQQSSHKAAHLATKVALAQDPMEASKLLMNNDHYGNGHSYMPTGGIMLDPSLSCDGSCDPVETRRINPTSAGLVTHPPIPVSELASHIDRLKANDNLLFSQEYESIETGQQFTWEHSNIEYNKPKNRYANVIAYDHSRVVLSPISGYAGSDYINANYCDGYRKPKAYIATQGPLDVTFNDFWRMVWEENSAVIVMLTKLEERTRIKCDQYWPTRGTQQYGVISVTTRETLDLAHYTVRTFHIQRQGESELREVRQLQFTAWPDHGVPDHPTPFLIFLKRVKSLNPSEAGPIVVHCSAGVGRTGAFVVIDCMLDRLRYESTVDIYGTVTCLRAQRNYMVQTEDQYVFIHDAVLDAVQSGSTEVPVNKLYTHLQKLIQLQPMENATGMELEFRSLAGLKMPNARFIAANLPCNKHKNRLVNILPYDATRVCLSQSAEVEGADYINASFIDGYRRRNGYIATQGPLQSTTDDFWRMLWEHNSTIVVMLTKLREMGREKCHPYWPQERSQRYGNLVVEPIAEYNMPQYILREFRMTNTLDGQSRTIRHFQYTEWPEQGIPKTGEYFIEFVGQVHKTREQFGQEGPISVHCSAGVGRTGLFIALSIILERMRYESVIDVFTTIKLLRTQRPNMVQSEDQYHFCYQAALEYLGSFDHFAMQ